MLTLALKNSQVGSGLLFRGLHNSITPYYFSVNFPSFVRNILYFFCGQGQIGSAPKSSWRQKKKDFSLHHAHVLMLYVCVLLVPSLNCQVKTGIVLTTKKVIKTGQNSYFSCNCKIKANKLKAGQTTGPIQLKLCVSQGKDKRTCSL